MLARYFCVCFQFPFRVVFLVYTIIVTMNNNLFHKFCTMHVNSRLKRLQRLRRISTSSVAYQPRSLIRLKKLQADYQCEDGRPIYLKGGFCDRILYTSTVVGALAGVGWVLFTIYEFAKPNSWREQ